MVRIANSLQARKILVAISPRLATRILVIGLMVIGVAQLLSDIV